MAPIIDDRRCGAALFVVLMFLVVVANLAFVALRSSSSEIHAASLFVDGARADELGRSIVSLTRYYISGDAPTRSRGGSFATEFDVGNVTIDYLSETARVDVNQSPVDLLKAVLLTAGLNQGRVDQIGAAIGQRRSAQQNGPYESAFEVAENWSLSDSEAREIIPLLTIANKGGTIDPLLTGPIILSALLDGSEGRVTDFRRKRNIGFPDEDTALSYFAEPVRKWLKFGPNGSVRALANVTTRRGLQRRYEAVFDSLGEGNAARIYYWRPLDREI